MISPSDLILLVVLIFLADPIFLIELLLFVSSLLQRASQEVKEAQMFREKMGTVSEWMGRVKLPRDLKAKIRAYYAEVLLLS